jgi:hypothetical protein
MSEPETSGSPWLEPLSLRRAIQIGTGDFLLGEHRLPEWAAFLVWAGWWIRQTQESECRVVLVVLVPDRGCSGILCSLGVILASVADSRDYLQWQEFLDLPIGQDVYLRLPESDGSEPAQAVLDTAELVRGLQGRWLTLSLPKRNAGGRWFVCKHTFSSYGCSLTPYPSRQREARLQGAADFFRDTHPVFDERWLLSNATDCTILTNLSRWDQELNSLQARVTDHSGVSTEYALSDLILSGRPQDTSQARILLQSPRVGLIQSAQLPVAILNGPKALIRWEEVKSRNLLVLLDRTEFEEDSRQLLFLLSSARDDSMCPVPEGVPRKLPPGVELMLFAIPSGM